MNTEQHFQNISTTIYKCYQKEISKYLASAHGKLNDADVITMVMNLTISTATNIYYSLKTIFPETEMDFDYMKATMCNTLVDHFSQIKDYNPKNNFIMLTPEQIQEINDAGSTTITEDGKERKITRDDVLISRDDADKLLDEAKDEATRSAQDKKIILQ